MPNSAAEKDDPKNILDGYDLRSLFAIAPPPAATRTEAEEESEEDEEDEESGDDSSKSDESDDDSDESEEDDDEDEDEKAKTANLIKALRKENKDRRLLIRKLRAENETLKTKVKAPVKKAAAKAEEEDDEDEDDKPLTSREQGILVRLAVSEGLTEHKLDPKRRKAIERLIDPDDIDFEGGEVVGMTEALAEIATDYPEWVLADESENGNGRNASGASTNRKKKTTSSSLDRKTLESKYPALRSR